MAGGEQPRLDLGWAAHPASPHVRLALRRGTARLCSVALQGRPCFWLGRSLSCDIPLEDEGAGEWHCALAHSPDGTVRLWDAGSPGGTFLTSPGGAQRIRCFARRWIPLEEGAALEFGECASRALLCTAPPSEDDGEIVLDPATWRNTVANSRPARLLPPPPAPPRAPPRDGPRRRVSFADMVGQFADLVGPARQLGPGAAAAHQRFAARARAHERLESGLRQVREGRQGPAPAAEQRPGGAAPVAPPAAGGAGQQPPQPAQGLVRRRRLPFLLPPPMPPPAPSAGRRLHSFPPLVVARDPGEEGAPDPASAAAAKRPAAPAADSAAKRRQL